MAWTAPPQTYLSGNTAGTTHVFGPVVTLQGSNITLSGSGNKIVLIGAAAATQTVAGSAAISAGTQSVSTGTIKFADSNGVTFGMSGSSQITATVKTDYLTAQTQFVLSASNGLAFGTNGSTVTGSYTVPVVPAQSNQTLGFYAVGNTTGESSSTTIDARTVSFKGFGIASLGYSSGSVVVSVPSPAAQTAYVFSDSNGISWGTNGSTVTATVKTDYLTTARRSTDAIGLNTAQTAVTWTVNSSGLSIDAGAYLTTARRSTDAIGLNTAKTNVTWTANSSGLSLDAGGYAGTVTGATGASLTVNTSGVSINLPAYLTTARGSTDAIGLNTAQTNVTWTANSSGLSLNAGGYAGTVSGATNCSVTANSSGVSVNVSLPKLSYWENPNLNGMTSWSGTSNSISIQRIYIPAQISATRADIVLNISGSSSGALSFRVNLGLYTATQSTLNSASTTSRLFSINSTSAVSYTAVSGPRSWSIGLGTWNMTPGEYFMALNMAWTTASTNTVFIAPYGNGSVLNVSGGETGAFANRTDYFRSAMINTGPQSTLPNTMQLSDMTQTGASVQNQPWVGFHGTF